MTKSSLSRRFTAAVAAGSALAAAAPALALDTHFVGARGQAMAGANTASVDDATAQYYNPAAFGFFNMRDPLGDQLPSDNNNLGRKDFGFGLGAGAGYRLNGDAASYVDRLASADITQYSDGIGSQQEVEDAIQLTSDLAGIDDPGTGFSADGNGELAFRMGSFGFGVRALAQAVGRVDQLDTTNFGTNIQPGDIGSNYTSDGTITNLTADQETTLVNADYDPSDIDAIDDAIGDAQLDTTNQDQAITLLAAAGPNGSATSIDQNQTRVTFRGFGVAEIPVTYGYAFNEHLSIGGNVKFMRGRVYGNQVIVFNDDSGDVAAKTDEKYQESDRFGVDLGLMARWPMLQVGIVGRNLNSPTFDGFTDPDTGKKYEDVTLEPQARAGVAIIPFETLTLEADYDLTENETLLDGYSTQFLSAGVEWDAFRFLALRVGAYDNRAADDVGVVYTAGLGLNLWMVRLDVAGAMSDQTTEVDGNDRPTESRFNAEISFDF